MGDGRQPAAWDEWATVSGQRQASGAEGLPPAAGRRRPAAGGKVIDSTVATSLTKRCSSLAAHQRFRFLSLGGRPGKETDLDMNGVFSDDMHYHVVHNGQTNYRSSGNRRRDDAGGSGFCGCAHRPD
jgi:hypothetical protein